MKNVENGGKLILLLLLNSQPSRPQLIKRWAGERTYLGDSDKPQILERIGRRESGGDAVEAETISI